MGIYREYVSESRPVLAMEVTLSENKTWSDSLVGYRCEELSDLQLDAGFYNLKYLNACYDTL